MSHGDTYLKEYKGQPKQEDGSGRVKLRNPNISNMSEDVLYHFALSTRSHDLPQMFGDVKFVVVGGSPRRMGKFAHFLAKEMKYNIPAGQTLSNIAAATDRYALYKVGSVLAASHGMGIPSISIMLHEIIKLVHHAKCTNVSFLRMGTCGGLGLEPGTVVVSESAVDGCMNPFMELQILGKTVRHDAVLDQSITDELKKCGRESDGFQTIQGKTMCTMDFYEGQGRLDGAFCDYTEQDKMSFLKSCYDQGVRNIEMESLCFAAMCHRAGIKGAVCCVTLLDRLKGDQIDTPKETLGEWDERPATIVSRFICKRIKIEK